MEPAALPAARTISRPWVVGAGRCGGRQLAGCAAAIAVLNKPSRNSRRERTVLLIRAACMEPCRVPLQLPLPLDEGGGRRRGRPDDQGREPRTRLRHALRGMEGEIPARGEPAAARRIRGGKPQALSLWLASAAA